MKCSILIIWKGSSYNVSNEMYFGASQNETRLNMKQHNGVVWGLAQSGDKHKRDGFLRTCDLLFEMLEIQKIL